MKAIITLLALFSLNAFADENYKCHSVQGWNNIPDTVLRISTGLISKKVTSVNLVHKIKGRAFEATANPFTSVDASYEDLDPDALAEASLQDFKELNKTDGRSSTSIALSESLLSFQKTGYAHFYAYSCFWLLDCFTTSNYYKCEKL